VAIVIVYLVRCVLALSYDIVKCLSHVGSQSQRKGNKTSAIADKKRHASLRLFVIVQHCYGTVRFIIYNTDY